MPATADQARKFHLLLEAMLDAYDGPSDGQDVDRILTNVRADFAAGAAAQPSVIVRWTGADVAEAALKSRRAVITNDEGANLLQSVRDALLEDSIAVGLEALRDAVEPTRIEHVIEPDLLDQREELQFIFGAPFSGDKVTWLSEPTPVGDDSSRYTRRAVTRSGRGFHAEVQIVLNEHPEANSEGVVLAAASSGPEFEQSLSAAMQNAARLEAKMQAGMRNATPRAALRMG